MFSHVMLGVNDLEVSRKFYDALLGTLGIAPGVANKNRYFYRSPTGTFAISTPINGEPATHRPKYQKKWWLQRGGARPLSGRSMPAHPVRPRARSIQSSPCS